MESMTDVQNAQHGEASPVTFHSCDTKILFSRECPANQYKHSLAVNCVLVVECILFICSCCAVKSGHAYW